MGYERHLSAASRACQLALRLVGLHFFCQSASIILNDFRCGTHSIEVVDVVDASLVVLMLTRKAITLGFSLILKGAKSFQRPSSDTFRKCRTRRPDSDSFEIYFQSVADKAPFKGADISVDRLTRST